MAKGVSVAVLLAAWIYVGLKLELPMWPAFVAWGCFYAAGGGADGLVKTVASALSGVFWMYLVSLISHRVGGDEPVFAVLVGLAGLAIVLQSGISLLSFIPGAFLGAAAIVAQPKFLPPAGSVGRHVSAIAAGAVLGYLSEIVAAKLKKG